MPLVAFIEFKCLNQSCHLLIPVSTCNLSYDCNYVLTFVRDTFLKEKNIRRTLASMLYSSNFVMRDSLIFGLPFLSFQCFYFTLTGTALAHTFSRKLFYFYWKVDSKAVEIFV